MLTGELERGCDILGGLWEHNGSGPLIDRQIPGSPRFVEARVLRGDDLSVQQRGRATGRMDPCWVDRHCFGLLRV
jgi:hypothetical protein